MERFGVPPDEGDRRAGADRRPHRQRPRRAGHRREDGCAPHQRIWRSRHAARPRLRDQTAEAAREPHYYSPIRRGCRARSSSSTRTCRSTCRSPRRWCASPIPRRCKLPAQARIQHLAPPHRRWSRRRSRRRRRAPAEAGARSAAKPTTIRLRKMAKPGSSSRTERRRAGSRGEEGSPAQLAATRAAKLGDASLRPQPIRDGDRAGAPLPRCSTRRATRAMSPSAPS